jgi:hypothetical protein
MSQSQDHLGWDCFVEGCITALLLECIGPLILQWKTQRSLEIWGVQFLKTLLLNLTHKQWIFCNANVHQKIDGLTQEQHLDVFAWIRTLMGTTPSDLLPCHHHLLDKHFHDLGNAEMIQRQLWIATMETVLSAASRVLTGHFTPGSLTIFNTRISSTQPRRSVNHHSQTTSRPRSNPPRHPHQQTFPASFWVPPRLQPIRTSPPDTHDTDLTGSHYHVHWKQKLSFKEKGGSKGCI